MARAICLRAAPRSMRESSSVILERFRRGRGMDIDLTLRQPYRDLLEKLGNPHLKLPPVVHVAGTNGKGSVCAFLRAAIEAAGYRVHVYTSPHLVTFHERIRIAGELIGEDELAEILGEVERLAEPGAITFFEAATAAAFAAFARHPADACLLEVGLGGRLDATNVIARPAATVITRLSFDHREYLGTTMAEIAREKAGIMRPGVPCFAGLQTSREALATLKDAVGALGAPLCVGGEDWRVATGGRDYFSFIGKHGTLSLPSPVLIGRHQLWNAGLALSALEALPLAIPGEALRQAMRRVDWPARLQLIAGGRLAGLLPSGWEVWLDGGHNDSAGEVLADQIKEWQRQDGAKSKPLFIVLGMLSTKVPREFLGPFAPRIEKLFTVTIADEALSFPAETLAELAHGAGVRDVRAAAGLHEAFHLLGQDASVSGRVLVCGSLYLAGQFLKDNFSK